MLNVGFQLNDFDTCLGPEATDLTERIALAFSAVVLCALCEPRYDPPRIPNKRIYIYILSFFFSFWKYDFCWGK